MSTMNLTVLIMTTILLLLLLLLLLLFCYGTLDVLGIEDYRIPCLGIYMILLSNCKIMLNL
jgi:hypothetical protein